VFVKYLSREAVFHPEGSVCIVYNGGKCFLKSNLVASQGGVLYCYHQDNPGYQYMMRRFAMRHWSPCVLRLISVCFCLGDVSFAAKTEKSLAKILGEYPELSSQMGAVWYYDWQGFPSDTASANLEFVPMIWGAKKDARGAIDANSLRLAIRKVLTTNPECKNLLTFNEPDAAKQSNLSVEQVLRVWPLFEQELEGKSIRLGSPGVAGINSEWLDKFMAGAIKHKYRVDFICVHRRVNFNNDPVNTVLRECRDLYKKYKKPIWITELELVGDGLTERQVINFYQKLADRLENDSSVAGMIERYAIAYAPPDTDIDYKIAARPYNTDRTLTEFGRAFQKLHESTGK